jgi:hypothetical protein
MTTKPTTQMIPPMWGGATMRLLGVSSVHRQWYGLKPPATMISRKCDVSCEKEASFIGE